jgi:methionyl-tRNA formyltransferase
MTTGAEYPYDQGDRLVDRNTYFYSPYRGREFLLAYRNARRRLEAESAVGPAAGSGVRERDDPDGFVPPACELFERVRVGLAASSSGEDARQAVRTLDGLVKRFEVTKRVFDDYDDEFRPRPGAGFRTISLYVQFAELLDAACAAAGRLPHLNALLKVLDTLSSVRGEIPFALRPRVLALVEAERAHVERLAAGLGVALW